MRILMSLIQATRQMPRSFIDSLFANHCAFADEGLSLMEVQMADDESLSVAGAEQMIDPDCRTSFISGATRTSLTLLQQ
jgi:hypothetical protein